MNEQVDDGDAFAVPELWPKSSLASFEHSSTEFLTIPDLDLSRRLCRLEHRSAAADGSSRIAR